MRLLAIQIIIVAIAAIALGGAIRRFRKREMSARWLVAWIVLWVGASIVVLIPKTSERIAAFFGVGRGVDVVVYLSIAVAFYLLFRVMMRIERIERDITKAVRAAALRNLESEDQSSVMVRQAHHDKDISS